MKDIKDQLKKLDIKQIKKCVKNYLDQTKHHSLHPPRGDRIYIGTSGYMIGNPNWWHNKKCKIYYPPKLKATELFNYYTRDFNSLEINSTFYKIPDTHVWQEWKQRVQSFPNFKYAVKMNKYMTHTKRLKDPQENWNRFWTNKCELLGNTLGVILFQFPPSFKFTPLNHKRLEELYTVLPKNIRFAFEFRDNSWWNETVYSLFQSYKWCMVTLLLNNEDTSYQTDNTPIGKLIIKKRKKWIGNLKGPIVYSPQTTNFTYIRCHGSVSQYMGTHSHDMNAIVSLINQNPGNKYIYFNNTDSTWSIPAYLKDIYCHLDEVERLPAAIYDGILLQKILNMK